MTAKGQQPSSCPAQNADPNDRQLATGQTIPQIQLGLYMMSGKEAYQSTKWALSAGYRGFDSAQMYHNERETGKAILDWLSSPDNTDGLKREDVHYTSKLASCSNNYNQVRRSIKQSVDACGLGYVDLFLLHSPYGGKEARLTSWKALEDAVEAGEVKMAGVSNFGVRHVSFVCPLLGETDGTDEREVGGQTKVALFTPCLCVCVCVCV
jgi:diketogulonate reductase-like aldo/keto reductase